jgi:hypothetical protein
LPKLIAAAQITNDAASSGDHAEVSAVLADAWILAADFAVKVNDDPAAWLTVDRVPRFEREVSARPGGRVAFFRLRTCHFRAPRLYGRRVERPTMDIDGHCFLFRSVDP